MAAAESPDPADLPSVGAQVRDLRRARGMTIQALADAIGRSVGYVSQIERDISAVSIPTLKGIADALGVQINWFFQGSAALPAAERDVVVRAGNRRRLDFTGTGVVEELLSPNLSGAFELVLGTFAPGATTGATPYARTGEEAGIVLKGSLEVWLGDRHFIVEEGDAFTFSLTEPHRSRNSGATEAVVLWVIAPPAY